MTPLRNELGQRRGSAPGWGAMTAAEIAEAQTLWETTDMTAAAIAANFTSPQRTVAKNSIVSHAHRYRWASRNPEREKPPRTIFDRLAELHEEFNRRTGRPPGAGYVRGPGAPLRG